MHRGRGRRDPFSNFGDPFAGFGGFGSFGGQGSLLSSFFGGRDPFDDPFFTRPFGGFFESVESSFFGGGLLPDVHPAGFEHQVAEPKRSRGPIIEEINSDDEKEEAEEEKKENSRKHGRSTSQPYVQEPDDEGEERKSKQLHCRNDHGWLNNARQQPQPQSFTFHSSTVTYGGANGAYYTSSSTRRAGSDGVMFEESKEADSTTGRATHRVSRGLHTKGHSVTRKLNSDGKVDTMQTLHNLHEEELPYFEEAWNGNARKHLPGLSEKFNGASGSGQNVPGRHGYRSLPSTERSQSSRPMPDLRPGSSRTQQSGKR